MSKQITIQISSEDIAFNIITVTEITPEIVECIGIHLDAILNQKLCHNLRGRITSVNFAMELLEKEITPVARKRFERLKVNIDDLSRMLEDLTVAI